MSNIYKVMLFWLGCFFLGGILPTAVTAGVIAPDSTPSTSSSTGSTPLVSAKAAVVEVISVLTQIEPNAVVQASIQAYGLPSASGVNGLVEAAPMTTQAPASDVVQALQQLDETSTVKVVVRPEQPVHSVSCFCPITKRGLDGKETVDMTVSSYAAGATGALVRRGNVILPRCPLTKVTATAATAATPAVTVSPMSTGSMPTLRQ